MMKEPRCWTRGCKHFIGVKQPDGTEMTERVVCEAFPDGIPDAIAYGPLNHLRPLPKQGNAVVFEPGLEKG